jgi:hypothetical protein
MSCADPEVAPSPVTSTHTVDDLVHGQQSGRIALILCMASPVRRFRPPTRAAGNQLSATASDGEGRGHVQVTADLERLCEIALCHCHSKQRHDSVRPSVAAVK